MRPLIFFLLTALLGVSASGQFVNGGFEDFSQLPNNIGQWSYSDAWSNAGSDISHPDYYHVDGTLGGDLPQTPVGYVLPFEGKAVMGFIAAGAQGLNRRSYLSTELANELEEGTTYQVSFSITNGVVTEGSFAGLGTSHLGMCFTIGEPVQNGQSPLDLTPQFQLQSVEYHREWKRFTFSFTSDDEYTHMTFGVFGSDQGKTITSFEPGNPSLAYYFVDDFTIEVRPTEVLESNADPRFDQLASNDDDIISPIDSYDVPEFFIPNAFTPNGDGDNDVFIPVINDISNYTFCIYSRWGELIFKTSNPGDGWDGSTIGDNEAGVGVYIWELRFTQFTDEGESYEVQQKGTVNLIR